MLNVLQCEETAQHNEDLLVPPKLSKEPYQLRKLLAIIENPQRGLNMELTELGTADRWLWYNGSVRFRKTEVQC